MPKTNRKWTEKESNTLANAVLAYSRQGRKLSEAYGYASKMLNRTVEACSKRWRTNLAEKYKTPFDKAVQQFKDNQTKFQQTKEFIDFNLLNQMLEKSEEKRTNIKAIELFEAFKYLLKRNFKVVRLNNQVNSYVVFDLELDNAKGYLVVTDGKTVISCDCSDRVIADACILKVAIDNKMSIF